MEFEYSKRTKEYLEQLTDFMRKHVYPSEPVFQAQLAGQPTRWQVPPIMEDLKAKARERGLWNLFLPESERGAGLSNLDYAPLCEVMGRSPIAPEIPMNGPEREVVSVPLQVDGETVLVTAVSVGNPHCVIFTDRLDETLVRRLGPLVERHPAFPNRINVQWARVASRAAVDILIWERGAGFTLASGSSSSAVACAAVKNGLCDHGLVTVRMPGGTLHVEVRPDWSIRLQGPVEEVYAGSFSQDFIDALFTDARPG